MTTPCQRWADRRPRYRPSGERINPALYTVAAMDGHREPRRFIEAHHYLASWPSVSLPVGLYKGTRLVGVCTFGVPAQARVFAALAPGHAALELSRLVLLDEVPGDGESWFVARAMSIARREKAVSAIVSYSDPLTRTTADGSPVCPGHVGVVYQALNAEYKGQGAARTVYLDRDGRTISERAISKIRVGDQGCIGAERELIARGADVRRFGESPTDWLARVLPAFRRVKHPGCHRYVWAWAPPKRSDATPSRVRLWEPTPYPRREIAGARAPVADHALTLF